MQKRCQHPFSKQGLLRWFGVVALLLALLFGALWLPVTVAFGLYSLAFPIQQLA